MKNYYTFALVLYFLTACHPRINSRGNVTVEENFSAFIVGRTTMNEILKKCGTPSLHRDNYSWIYVGYKIEEDTFKNIKLIHEFTVRMMFDQNGILRLIEKIDPKNKVNVLMNEEITNLIGDAKARRMVNEELLVAKQSNNDVQSSSQ